MYSKTSSIFFLPYELILFPKDETVKLNELNLLLKKVNCIKMFSLYLIFTYLTWDHFK